MKHSAAFGSSLLLWGVDSNHLEPSEGWDFMEYSMEYTSEGNKVGML